MLHITKRNATASMTAAALVLAGIGCKDLPGSEEEQGAVIGGAGGAVAGGALYEDNRALGALVGGLLGAGGGYLVGSRLDKNEGEAREAADEARQNPATVEDVRDSDSADLDYNGFVTMDELIAMKEAGLSDREILDRAEATDQVFQLNADQEDDLRDAGYDGDTIDELEDVNRDVVEEYQGRSRDRVSSPAGRED